MNTTDDMNMADTTTLTVRLSKAAKERLGSLAKSTHRSQNFLVATAIDEYLKANVWQVEKIRQAVEQADTGGPFYDHEKVMDYLDRRARGVKPERPKPVHTP